MLPEALLLVSLLGLAGIYWILLAEERRRDKHPGDGRRPLERSLTRS
jgi:hypothetical protein